MSIFAEDIDNATAFFPGFFRFSEEGPFSQAVLAITPICLYIYDDNTPDKVEGADWTYNIKCRIAFESIELVTNETIKTKRKLSEKTSRLIIKLKDEGEGEEKKEGKTYHFYYRDADENFALNFMAGFKRYKVANKSITTKLIY